MNEERMKMIAQVLADYIAQQNGVDELMRVLELTGATDDDLKELGYSEE